MKDYEAYLAIRNAIFKEELRNVINKEIQNKAGLDTLEILRCMSDMRQEAIINVFSRN